MIYDILFLAPSSGTGTNLKVGKAPIFSMVVPLDFFGSKSTISCFDERFRDGQHSLVSFLFAVLLTVPPCPMESAPQAPSVHSL